MSQYSARGPAWQAFRRECIKRAGWRCERCKRLGRFEIHHIIPVAKGGKVFDFDNVEVLCRQCHIDHHRVAVNPQRQEWYDHLGI